jgi:N-methylhydantoinase A
VTDADLLLGRMLPDRFAGGTIALDPAASRRAVAAAVGVPLGIAETAAALAISEVVEENMANVARVHAVERGKELAGRTLIAFGGAAPLHAARLAEKLDIGTVLVPTAAGVGSAVGFLAAPVAFEVVRSRYVRLDASFDPSEIEALRGETRAEAEAVVRRGAPGTPLVEAWTADMRYRGQGHDVVVTLPPGPVEAAQLTWLFEAQYESQFGRTIPGLEAEIMSWTLRLAAAGAPVERYPPVAEERPAAPSGRTRLADPQGGDFAEVPVYRRADLQAGDTVDGPALLAEDETTTLVAAGFTAKINGLGHIVLTRRAP